MTTSLLLSKIIDIGEARRRRDQRQAAKAMSSKQERRRNYRRESTDRTFVQIVNCPEDPDLVGTTISCSAVDVSARGLKVTADRFVPAGCELELWIDIRSRPGKFFLTNDVRWSRQVNGDCPCEFGVELHEGVATDISDVANHQRLRGCVRMTLTAPLLPRKRRPGLPVWRAAHVLRRRGPSRVSSTVQPSSASASRNASARAQSLLSRAA